MNLHTRIHTRKSSGFTVAEISVVIVVVAILATLVVVGYNTVLSNTRTQAVMADLSATAAQLSK